KYLNNIVEQGHRFIKKRMGPTLDFKNFYSKKSPLTTIENTHIIQFRGQSWRNRST
ncbi:MAG: DDE-type integrase/transposase/recombinase, partial [Proteobacteria bacterium]|nr:DDE-type integrase/transposase/recombinase [Pseudomonadota bacterium]